MSALSDAWRGWRALSPGHQQAALTAVGLVLALFLPWYEKSAFVLDGGELVSARESLSAFEVVSYVEGAVMLVAAGILALVYTRARRLPFHLPGGDGTVIAAGGAWAGLLLVWRLFDKPDATGRAVTVGVEWGWFVAVVLAAALTVHGLRLRAAAPPEPHNPAAAEPGDQPPSAGPDPRPAAPEDPGAVGARPASDVIGAQDAPGEAPTEEAPTRPLHDPGVPQAVDEPRVPPPHSST